MDATLRSTLRDAVSDLLAYLRVEDTPVPADIIWGLGSHEPRVAERAADLFHQGLAPAIVFSGGTGHRWRDLERSEAELFAEVAIARGVPPERIVIEDRSTNTAENVQYSSALFRERGLEVTRAVLITIPPFQRRASLTVQTHRPDIRCVNCPIDWGSPSGWDERQFVLVARLCAGEIRRLAEYPGRGFLRWDASNLPVALVEAAKNIERHVSAW